MLKDFAKSVNKITTRVILSLKFRAVLRQLGMQHAKVLAVLTSVPVCREPFRLEEKWILPTNFNTDYKYLKDKRSQLIRKFDREANKSQYFIEDDICLVIVVEVGSKSFDEACIIEFLVYAPDQDLSRVPDTLLQQAGQFWSILFPKSKAKFVAS